MKSSRSLLAALLLGGAAIGLTSPLRADPILLQAPEPAAAAVEAPAPTPAVVATPAAVAAPAAVEYAPVVAAAPAIEQPAVDPQAEPQQAQAPVISPVPLPLARTAALKAPHKFRTRSLHARRTVKKARTVRLAQIAPTAPRAQRTVAWATDVPQATPIKAAASCSSMLCPHFILVGIGY